MIKFLLGMLSGVALVVLALSLNDPVSKQETPKNPALVAAEAEAQRALEEAKRAQEFSEKASADAPYDPEANMARGTMVHSDIGDGLTIGDLEPNNSAQYTIESGRGADGYRVDQATMDHSTISLRIYKYRSEKAFRAAIRATGQSDDTEGLAYFSRGTNECIILVRDPAYRYQPTEMGHELTHCIYGDFHDDEYPG